MTRSMVPWQRTIGLASAVLALSALPGAAARADVPAPRSDDVETGLAVIGLGSTVDVAWPLARGVYGEATLRPPTLDEPHARVLVGETPGDDSTPELRDLADTRAAIHGDDAASRRLLSSIALGLHVKGLVVVEAATNGSQRPTARVFVASPGAFEPVRYEPDPAAAATWGGAKVDLVWTGAVQSLKRGFAAPAKAAVVASGTTINVGAAVSLPAAGASDAANVDSRVSAPGASPLATHAVASAVVKPANSDVGASKRAFYQSPWFWAAAGAAVFAAGAVYFATRNDGPDNIQLQVQVPK